MKKTSLSQIAALLMGLILSFQAQAQDARRAELLEQNIIKGLTEERNNSVYWEKWNLGLSQAVQFVVANEMKMGTVLSSVNKAYYFYRDARCDISSHNIQKPLTIAKGTQYALVDYMFSNQGKVEILVYSRDKDMEPSSLSITCDGITPRSKVKDLQQALLKAFELQPGRNKFLGIF